MVSLAFHVDENPSPALRALFPKGSGTPGRRSAASRQRFLAPSGEVPEQRGGEGPIDRRETRSLPEVIALRPGQNLVADGQRARRPCRCPSRRSTPARGRDSRSGHEDRSGLDAVADGTHARCRASRSRRSARRGVVHQRDGLLVVLTFMMPDDGAEAFLAHHAHLMVDISQHLRRQIGRAGLVLVTFMLMWAVAPLRSASASARGSGRRSAPAPSARASSPAPSGLPTT